MDTKWYCVSSDDAKTHFCSNRDLARLVADNLISQKLNNSLEIKTSPESFDGMTKRYEINSCLEQSDNEISLPESVIIEFMSRDYLYLKKIVHDMKLENEAFCKLHDDSGTILCLTLEQASVLKERFA